MTNIAGVFDDKIQAYEAVAKLLESGFNKDDFSLIVSDHVRHTIFAAPTDDESNRTARGGTAGALFGGALGALIAGLTVVGIAVLPGSGLLVAGPLIAMLTGAGAGATVGGISGALISAGFAVDEAKKYEKEIQQGRAVIVVHTTEEKAQTARLALRMGNASIQAA